MRISNVLTLAFLATCIAAGQHNTNTSIGQNIHSKLWKPYAQMDDGKNLIYGLAFGFDSKEVFASNMVGSVQEWSTSDGRLLHIFGKSKPEFYSNSGVSATRTVLSCSESAPYLGLATFDGTCTLYNYRTNKVKWKLSGLGSILAASFTKDGKYFVYCSENLGVIDVKTGKVVAKKRGGGLCMGVGDKRIINYVVAAPPGKFKLIFQSSALPSLKPEANLNIHMDSDTAAWSMTFSDDCSRLLFTGAPKTLGMYSFRDKKALMKILPHRVSDAVFLSKSHSFIVSQKNDVWFASSWDAPRQVIFDSSTIRDVVLRVAVSENDKFLCFATGKGKVILMRK